MVGLDDVAGYTVSSAAEIGGAMLNSRLAESRQHDAQDFSAGQFAHRYQTEVQDLMRAGLNPMLGYMQGPGSAPQSSAASAVGVSPSEVYNQHRIASSQEALNVANAEKAKAEKDNVVADTTSKLQLPAYWQAKTVEATNSASQAEATAKRIRTVEIPKVQQEILNLKSKVDKNKSDIQLNNSLMDANAMLTALRSTEAMLNGWKAKELEQKTDIMAPKARASKEVTAGLAATSENIGQIGKNAWRWMFPTITGD